MRSVQASPHLKLLSQQEIQNESSTADEKEPDGLATMFLLCMDVNLFHEIMESSFVKTLKLFYPRLQGIYPAGWYR
jgi:hypothetical protein